VLLAGCGMTPTSTIMRVTIRDPSNVALLRLVELGVGVGGTALLGILVIVADYVFFPGEKVTTQTVRPDGTVIEE
jgi:hypothetical protein